MKKQTKLVLMATGLSCAVLGCLGSATYAWFVTKNNVGVRHTHLTVNSSSPNLTVVLTHLTPSSNSKLSMQDVQDIEDSFGFTDVSSKFGETFYRKNNDETGYAALAADKLPGAVMQYGLKVSNLEVGTPMDLRLNTVIDYQGGNNGLALRPWVRLGVYECTDETYASKKENGFEKAFMYSSTAEGTNHFINGTSLDSIGTYASGELVNFGAPTVVASSVQAVSDHYYKFSIWMEGTATDNQDDARGGEISVASFFQMY